MIETWFIERPDGDRWVRYAGAFDTYGSAQRYFDTLCPRNYRIMRYHPDKLVEDNPRCFCPDCNADLGDFYSNRIVMKRSQQ